MLQDRFRLQVHQQKKETNVYHLVSVQGILKLKRTGDARDATTQMRDATGHMWATKFDMELLARYLGGELGFPVVEQTGVAGVYDFETRVESGGEQSRRQDGFTPLNGDGDTGATGVGTETGQRTG